MSSLYPLAFLSRKLKIKSKIKIWLYRKICQHCRKKKGFGRKEEKIEIECMGVDRYKEREQGHHLKKVVKGLSKENKNK